MVCTFFLFVLPALLYKTMSWLWCLFTGKKQPEQPKNVDTKVPAAAKGQCPIHVVMRFFGFKIPKKKAAKCPMDA